MIKSSLKEIESWGDPLPILIVSFIGSPALPIMLFLTLPCSYVIAGYLFVLVSLKILFTYLIILKVRAMKKEGYASFLIKNEPQGYLDQLQLTWW